MKNEGLDWGGIGAALAILGAGFSGFLLREASPLVSALSIAYFVSVAFIILISLNAQSRANFAAYAQTPFAWYNRTMDGLRQAIPNAIIPVPWDSIRQKSQSRFERITDFIEPHPRDGTDRIQLAEAPWSWPVLATACFLALAYPVTFALGQFTLTGQSPGMGGVDLIPADAPRWQLAVAFGGVVGSITCSILASATSKGVFEKLSRWLRVLAMVLAMAAVAVAVAVAFAVAGAAAVAVAVAGAAAVAVAGAVAGAVAAAVAVAGAGAVAVAVAVAILIALSWATRTGLGRPAFLLLIALGLAVGTYVTALPGQPADNIVFLTVLILLPLTNALFDWLSYGFTFHLLFRYGQVPDRPLRPFFAGILDLVAAILMFFFLSLALLTLLWAIDYWAPQPIFRPADLLSGLRDGTETQPWIILMIASTFLPTLLHLTLGCFSFGAWILAKVWSAALRDPNDTTELGFAGRVLWAASIPIAAFAGFALPGLLIIGLAVYGGAIRSGYIDFLTHVAVWL